MNPAISTHIGGQLWKVISRITSGEAGVYEKTIEHFELTTAEKAVLSAMEELRKQGHYDKKEPITGTDKNVPAKTGFAAYAASRLEKRK